MHDGLDDTPQFAEGRDEEPTGAGAQPQPSILYHPIPSSSPVVKKKDFRILPSFPCKPPDNIASQSKIFFPFQGLHDQSTHRDELRSRRSERLRSDLWDSWKWASPVFPVVPYLPSAFLHLHMYGTSSRRALPVCPWSRRES